MITTLKKTLRLIATGFCMGAADIVPGVSGGTMAFILGIYDELIHSIRTFGSADFWRSIISLRIGDAWKKINVHFLVAIAVGILGAIASLSHLISHLLETYPEMVWSFFFGLVLASVHVVFGRINRKTLGCWFSVLVGFAVAFLIVGLVPVQTPEAPWFLILSGAIAICAMILPGISGSFILVLLGKYEYILAAVKSRDIATIGYVGIGAAIGIILFADILSWLLRRYHDLTIAFLTGLMIGSLRKIWPWKSGDMNILPDVAVDNVQFFSALGLMLFGFLVVIVLEQWGQQD